MTKLIQTLGAVILAAALVGSTAWQSLQQPKQAYAPGAPSDARTRFLATPLTRDARGMVKVMKMEGKKGTCIAEVVYEEHPRIYVVAITKGSIRNLGYLEIQSRTRENLTDEFLELQFNRVIQERCLPEVGEGTWV